MRGRPLSLALVAALLSAMTACSSSSSLSLTTEPSSKTPVIPFGQGTASQRAAVLTLTDLERLPRAPADIQVTPPGNQENLYQDSDPRGFCGARIALPDLSKGTSVEFTSATMGGAQAVIDLGKTAATAVVDALSADNRPGCAGYQSLTNTGTTQDVKLVKSIPTPKSIDQATAGLLTISNGGPHVNAYTFFLRQGGRLDFTFMLSESQLPQTFISALLNMLAQKLRNSFAIT